MEVFLIINYLSGYVNCECEKPQVLASQAAYNAFLKSDSKAKADTILFISPSELKQVKHCSTSRDV